ncbi:hypothetical protein ACFPN2_36605 [Steroidobacter flavus]|uniref:3-hydroxyacyl-CoA dehydrogenase NAD binding domain-containing protein n=1 Tax=Steroidobacter flavus TaxID=1842136 RepID=A0ABV8T3T9_9GAMM
MVLKAAFVFVAGGLMGSGIVALTRSDDAAKSAESAVPAGALIAAELHHETNQPGYVQARFAAQRPFAALGPVTRQ